MKITVGDPVAAKNPRNAYVLYVSLMHGDADAYTTIKYGPFAADDEFELADLENKIKALQALGDDPDTYNDNPAFQTLKAAWEQQQGSDAWGDEDDCWAAYEDHYVRFFDKDGVEFQTKVAL